MFTQGHRAMGNSTCAVVLVIIIITAFKGAIRDFLQSPHCANMYAQMAWAQLCANHVKHIKHSSRATCCVTCHMVWRDSSAIKFDRVWITFIVLYSIGWTINRCSRGGNWSIQRKPLAASFRKCHILQPEDSSPKRDSNPHNCIGGRLGKQTC